MIPLVLVVLLVAAVGGCVCVVWAERGGPRWARAVAALTLGAGRMLRGAGKNDRRRSVGGSGDGAE
ncbi:hypothetical protein ACIQM4_24780 [Streptomyces sp. NPDC091272]|uniref:hypothetical protein n=1 Tax=Streptomyces sp. NPDC091272 TaxID=3365981 RepID=UPI0037F7EDDC